MDVLGSVAYQEIVNIQVLSGLKHLMMQLIFILKRVDPIWTLKLLSKRKVLSIPGSLPLRLRLCRSLIMLYFHVES